MKGETKIQVAKLIILSLSFIISYLLVFNTNILTPDVEYHIQEGIFLNSSEIEVFLSDVKSSPICFLALDLKSRGAFIAGEKYPVNFKVEFVCRHPNKFSESKNEISIGENSYMYPLKKTDYFNVWDKGKVRLEKIEDNTLKSSGTIFFSLPGRYKAYTICFTIENNTKCFKSKEEIEILSSNAGLQLWSNKVIIFLTIVIIILTIFLLSKTKGVG